MSEAVAELRGRVRVAGIVGAHERTESEWRALADAAGLRVDAVHEALIEARCP